MAGNYAYVADGDNGLEIFRMDTSLVLTSIVVSPSAATLAVGEIQEITATAKDQNNNPMAGINISWTVSNSAVGNVTPLFAETGPYGNASTTFTSRTVGNTTVNAMNGTVGSANVSSDHTNEYYKNRAFRRNNLCS